MLAPRDLRERDYIREAARAAARSVEFESVHLLGFDWLTRVMVAGPPELSNPRLAALDTLQTRMCYRAVLYTSARHEGRVQTIVLDVGGDMEAYALQFNTDRWHARWSSPSEITVAHLRQIVKR